MPKNNQKKSKPQSQPQTRKAFLLELLKMIGVILVAIPAIVGLVYAGWFIKINSAQSDMKEYLQKKYGQEFVVENYRVEGSGFGVEGDPTADAYPKNNPALRFRVWDYGSIQSGTHLFGDGYLISVWEEEYTRKIREGLYLASYSNLEYEVDLGIDRDASADINYKIGIPSFYNYKLIDSNRRRLSMELIIFNRSIMDDTNKLWGIIELIKKENIERTSLRICDKGYENCHNLDRNIIKSINSVSDVESYLYKLRGNQVK